MGRFSATLAGVLVLAIIAGFFTEVTLAIGHSQGTSDDVNIHVASHSPMPSKTPPIATPTATPSVTPSTTPTPAVQTATTNSFVHLRQGNSTSTPIIANLNGGTVVQLLPYSDSQWQEVSYNGTTGYVYKSYLNY